MEVEGNPQKSKNFDFWELENVVKTVNFDTAKFLILHVSHFLKFVEFPEHSKL